MDVMENKIYDVIIIGAGPAGMGAAIYAKRAGLEGVVLDKSPISGGQVLTTYEVDNYLGLPGLSGGDLSDKFREHADKLGVEFITANVVKIDNESDNKIVTTDEGEFIAKTIVLATGANHSKLGVTGENELAGVGVSYCATCDGAFFRKRTVAVVGGGDVAVEDAIFLAGLCAKVYLIHRRDELRAAASLQNRLMLMNNIEIIWDSEVTQICGKDIVEKIEIKNKKTNDIKSLEVNGIFIAVGVVPDTELLKGIVQMDEKGYIIADETCTTSASGIYAAGDIRKKPMRQIITAVADGANAINSAQKFLNC
jgi:thioredoxin reductase (NADPH)